MHPLRVLTRGFATTTLLVGGLSACSAPATPTHVRPPTETAAPPPPTATAAPIVPTLTEVPATKAPPTEVDLGTEIDTYLAGLTQLGGFSGVALVARGDEILLRNAYGYADRDKEILNTLDTRFRIGHVTAPFDHIAFRQLEAMGKLSEQDLVCAYFADCPAAWKAITLGQILSASSGIPSMTEGLEFDRIKATPVAPDDLLSRIMAQPLLFEPGTSVAYSTSDYVVLGLVIEKAVGTSYEAFLQDHILTPLAMTHTGFEPQPADLAVGYTNWNKDPADTIDLSVTYGWGGLSTTADDLFTWAQALQTDALLPAGVRGDMFTARGLFPDSTWGYADGWVVLPEFGRTEAYFEGGLSGFSAVVKLIPEDQVVVILLCNQEDVEAAIVGLEVLKRLYAAD